MSVASLWGRDFSDEDWIGIGATYVGFDSSIRSMVTDSNGILYACGEFDSVGGDSVRSVVKWNGTDWESLGFGTSNGIIDLAIDGSDNLYAIQENGLVWMANATTPSWSSIGTVGIVANAVYANNAGGVYVSSIKDVSIPAKYQVSNWDGNAWQQVGGNFNGEVSDMVLDSLGNLYVTGVFTEVDGVAVNRVAVWNGTSWSALGDGLESNGSVSGRAIDISPLGGLYVAGVFTKAGGVDAGNIARWDGNNWSALGDGLNLGISFSFDPTGVLYAKDSVGIHKWDGIAWAVVPLEDNITGTGGALHVDKGGNLYVAATIAKGISGSVNSAAQWDGARWNPLVSGFDGNVFDVAISPSGKVYAGGNFVTVSGQPALRIVSWDGTHFEPLGDGVGGTVDVIVVDTSENVYVGGDFTTAGGNPANKLAMWNGANWSALAEEVNGDITALAIDANGDLIAGGQFTNAGGNNLIRYVGRWDGATWHRMSNGNNERPVFSLIADSLGNVFAGTDRDVRMWNGTAWTVLGEFISGGALALALDSQGHLYAGGTFTSVGGVDVGYVAKWNGTEWDGLDGGVAGDFSIRVETITIDANDKVFVGGNFTSAGGSPASNIARWDGYAWQSIGSGTDDRILAMAIDDSYVLHVGGLFETVGQKRSAKFAYTRPVPELLLSPSGDERWEVGSLKRIEWFSGLPLVKLEYSVDGGTTWKLIVDNFPGNLSFLDWTVPDDTAQDVRMRLTEIGGFGRVQISRSFRIASLQINNLQADTLWKHGEFQTIDYTLGGLDAVLFQGSDDNGVSWFNLQERPNSSQVGEVTLNYNLLPPRLTTNLRIRVIDTVAASGILDEAPGVIRVRKLDIDNVPNEIGANSNYNIKWQSFDVTSVDIEYFKASQNQWLRLASRVSANAQSFLWKVPLDLESGLKLRLIDSSDPTFISESSEFTITPPTLSVIPYADAVTAGEELRIFWQQSGVDFVDIELWKPSEDRFVTIAQSVPASPSRFDWPAIFEPGEKYYIRVKDALNTNVSSNGNFFTISLPIRFVRLYGDAFDTELPSYLNTFFHALDQNFRAIEDLSVAEFILSENGTPVSEEERIVRLLKLDQLNYRMRTVLMLDNSTSITPEEKPEVLRAARAFINRKLPKQEIAIYHFSSDAFLLQDFTDDASLLTAAIDSLAQIPRLSSTNLFGSVRAGLDRWEDAYSLTEVVQGNLVILTDGDHNSSPETVSTVTSVRGNKQIFTLSFGSDEDINQSVLDELGNGGTYRGNQVADLEGIFDQILNDLEDFSKSFYWLGYATPKQGDFVNTFEISVLNNQNGGQDSTIVNQFSSSGFSPVIPGIVINGSPANPFGVSVLNMPILGSDVLTIETTFTVGGLPYEFQYADPQLLSIIPLAGLFEHQITSSGTDGVSTVVTINDTVNDYTKQLTVNFVDSTGFTAFAQGLGLSGADLSLGSAPFGDGVTNIIRYTMGLGVPANPASLPTVQSVMIDGVPTAVYQYQQNKGAVGYELVPQSANVFGNWVDIPLGDITQLPDIDANTEAFEVMFPYDGLFQVFFRVRVKSSP